MKEISSIEKKLFANPFAVIAFVLVVTVFFALQIPGLKMYSDFADLLPQNHEYIKLHNEIRDTFGGANVVIVGVEVEQGTIFKNDVLGTIHRLTQGVDKLSGMNHNLVKSLTHRTSRKVSLSETGGIQSDVYYDPTKANLTEKELLDLEQSVRANPQVYGLLVSPDLKSALIKGTLNEGALDYAETFKQLQTLRKSEAAAGINIYATGQPILIGWVHSYLPQIVEIFLFTAVIMLLLLVLYFRQFYGVAIPLAGVGISSIWGLGIISLLGYNLDPLTMVIPFLISARALSHGIQLVQRYYHELPHRENGREAARATFHSLFRPGSMGVLSDAVSIAVLTLGSIPINTKLGVYASLWSISLIFAVLLLVPVVLSILPNPKVKPEKKSVFSTALNGAANFIANAGRARTIIFLIAGLYVVGGMLSSMVQIGEAEPGSPLLYQHHDYNQSSRAINQNFPGSEELYVIARTPENGGIKQPHILHALGDFQRHMLYDPELGGVKGVPNLITQVNRLLHNDDPRFAQIPHTGSYVGGLTFAYMASSPTPGALKEFIDTDEREANMVFYYKDHKGETIRRSIHQVRQWIDEVGQSVDGLSLHLAGGTIGVTAAINEAAFETNVIVVPLVLLLIFILISTFYRSMHAGFLMFLAMSFATVFTYAYMGIRAIGINVNTVPIIAVGIGVGIDYSIYIMDRIREEMQQGADSLIDAVHHGIKTTGAAVCFTAITLMAGVIMWVFVSDLRFQADAALLLCVMLVLNAFAAIFVVPAWIVAFKPKFIDAVKRQTIKLTNEEDL